MELFLTTLIISAMATAFAVAYAFAYYRYRRRPRPSSSFMNTSFVAVSVIAGCLLFGDSSKTIQGYLFFIAYFAHIYSLGIHISTYDDTFRTLFLSMGYNRQEYFWKYLLIQARWRLIDSNLSFSLIASTVLLLSSILKDSFPDQRNRVLVGMMLMTLAISVVRWIYERFGNKFSKAE